MDLSIGYFVIVLQGCLEKQNDRTKKGFFNITDEGVKMKLSKGCGSDHFHLANTRHLTRIIAYLSEVDCAYLKQISRETGIEHNRVKNALVFLMCYDMVLIKKTQKLNRWAGVKYYELNKELK